MFNREPQEYDFMTLLAVFLTDYFFSWIITTSVIWAIMWCFEITFNLRYATGIWILMTLVKEFFNESSSL